MSVETSNEAAQFNNYSDRCDRCGAQAQKKVIKGEGILMFCNHHYNDHAEKLTMTGWSVVVREEVSVKPELVDA